MSQAFLHAFPTFISLWPLRGAAFFVCFYSFFIFYFYFTFLFLEIHALNFISAYFCLFLFFCYFLFFFVLGNSHSRFHFMWAYGHNSVLATFFNKRYENDQGFKKIWNCYKDNVKY